MTNEVEVKLTPVQTLEAKITDMTAKIAGAQRAVDESAPIGPAIYARDMDAVRSVLNLPADAELTEMSGMEAFGKWHTAHEVLTKQLDSLKSGLTSANEGLVTAQAEAKWDESSAKLGASKDAIATAMATLTPEVKAVMVAFGVKSVLIHADTEFSAENAPGVSIVPATADKVEAFATALKAVSDSWPEVRPEIAATGFKRATFIIDGFGNETAPNVSIAKAREVGGKPSPTLNPNGTKTVVTGTRGAPVSVNGTEYPTALAAFQAHYTEHPTYSKPGKGEAWAQNILSKSASTNMRELVAAIPGGSA